MTNKDAEKYLEQAVVEMNAHQTLTEASYYCEALGMACRALEANQSWIGVKDALPDLVFDDVIMFSEDVYILAVDDSDAGCWEYYQMVGCYTSSGWCYFMPNGELKQLEHIPYRVTHWMPLMDLPA